MWQQQQKHFFLSYAVPYQMKDCSYVSSYKLSSDASASRMMSTKWQTLNKTSSGAQSW